MSDKQKKPDPCTITLENVRLSFADAIFEAKKQKGDENSEPKFHCNGILEDKNSEQTKANLAKWRVAKEAALTKKFGANKAEWPQLKPEKFAMRDGDGEDWDGYAGNYYISASAPADQPPLLLDRKRNDVQKKDGLLYSGCYVNLHVNVWAQNNKYGKRVNATLLGVQFIRKGEAFGRGPVDRNEAFRDLSEEGDVDTIGEEAEDNGI